MSNVVNLNTVGSQFSALIPHREEKADVKLKGIDLMPSFSEEFDRLREEVLAEKNVDIPSQFRDLTMDDMGCLVLKDQPMVYTKHALGQAVTRIKPEGVVGLAGYLAVCPPDLRAQNYNYWHQESFGGTEEHIRGNLVLLRTRDSGYEFPMLRAVVSQSYAVIDDMSVLGSLQQIVPVGAKLRSLRGDVRSRYDLIWPTRQEEVRPGDTVMVSLRAINSETGTSSIRLEPMVFHASSRSLFIIPRAGREIAVRHVGEAALRVGNAYTTMMEEVTPFIEMLRASYTDSIYDHFPTVQEMWECLEKAFKFSESRVNMFRRVYLEENGGGRGAVAQAMATIAQELDVDSSEEVMRAAGLLIANGWNFVKRYLNA